MGIILFALAVACTVINSSVTKNGGKEFNAAEVLLSYLFLFNVGVMGLINAYMHIFEGPETARMIGWLPENPFQFEVGVSNLSFGILGIIAYWIRGKFWDALAIGQSIFLLGCFVGHVYEYNRHNNISPYNMGINIWFNDLFLPLLLLGAFMFIRATSHEETHS